MQINNPSSKPESHPSFPGWIRTLGIPATIAIACVFIFNVTIPGNDHFKFLAESFAHGKAYFLSMPGSSWHDTVPYGGQHYWPLGPFPGVLLMPLLPISAMVPFITAQGLLNPFLVAGIGILVFLIARLLSYNHRNSVVLASVLLFSSPFLAIALFPKSWFFSQSVTTLLILLALYESMTRRRWWLIGCIFGLILGTRVTAALGIVYFALEALFQPSHSITQKLKHILALFIPVVIIAVMLGFYNRARFDSFFEQGYSTQNAAVQLEKNRSVGLFHPRHIPINLYYLLLAPPLPVFSSANPRALVFPYLKADPWGMSLFLTSPYLLLFLYTSLKDKFRKRRLKQTEDHPRLAFLMTTSLLILLPILLYYGVGFRQFGYRYALDFFPFLFLFMIVKYKQRSQALSQTFISVVNASILINLFFFLTFICGETLCVP